MPLNFADYGIFGEAFVILVSMVVPTVLFAIVAYWIIRLAVRDGVLDARRRCGEVVPENDPGTVVVSSRSRKALYLTGAVLLVLGMLATFANVTFGPAFALIGFAMIAAYAALFAIDAARGPKS